MRDERLMLKENEQNDFWWEVDMAAFILMNLSQVYSQSTYKKTEADENS